MKTTALKYILLFLLFSLSPFAYAQATQPADKNRKIIRFIEPVEMTRAQLSKVKTIYDLIPTFEKSCEISECELNCNKLEGGGYFIMSKDGKDIGKQLDFKNTTDITVDFKSPCKARDMIYKVYIDRKVLPAGKK